MTTPYQHGHFGKASDLDHTLSDNISHSNPELDPCCFQMYVKFIRPSFEVVKEGRILFKIKH